MLKFFTQSADKLESQFRTHYLAADARQTKIAIAAWLFPLLLMAYGDYGIFGRSPVFAALLAARLSLFLFSLYTIRKLSRVATTQEYDAIFLRWAALSLVVLLILNYSWAPYVPPTGTITVLAIFSTYMVFPNRLCIRIIPPITLSSCCLVMQWWVKAPGSPTSLFSLFVALLMANVLGIIFSNWLHNHRLAEFKARLEETRIREELIRLASTDALTGIFNRRKLIELATEEFAHFKNGHQPLSVLMIDIDDFKRLNDSNGHETGDLILADFSALVKNNLSQQNIWGRLGGDEFVLVLPGLPCEQARLTAERIRRNFLESASWRREPLNFTISIGITEAREMDQSVESVIRRADQALYLAKQNGRNRTEVL
jgi:diguanylate cyclase (GGDEF) domain